jgi:transcription initiation factor TFIID TATA-box-binding protein
MTKKSNKTSYGTSPKIVNIVSSGQFFHELNLDLLVDSLDVKSIEYLPDSYPGMLIKIHETKCHITLYRNGKYIILGGSTIDEIYKTYQVIEDKLKSTGAFESETLKML